MKSKVLLVDDDAMILAGLKRKLRNQFRIETALSRDFLEPKNLTFFVLIIKNWCLCLSLLKIGDQIMTN